MSQFNAVPDIRSAGNSLGILEALGMGWRLMWADFWPLWIVTIVAGLLFMATSMVPFGGLLAFPPIAAGYIYVLSRKIDGEVIASGQLFEGFRQRFTESLLSMLPLLVAWIVLGLVIVGFCMIMFVPMFMVMGRRGSQPPDEAMIATFVVFEAVIMALSLAMWFLQMFFVFASMAVWERPHAGWEAAKDSMRLVARHLWPMIGFWLLSLVLFYAAEFLGFVACCVGLVFTMPAVTIWLGLSLIFLYRSYTGQPLVQRRSELDLEVADPEPPAAV
jgi:hypothetical protein